jgi:hypothetical protein
MQSCFIPRSGVTVVATAALLAVALLTASAQPLPSVNIAIRVTC